MFFTGRACHASMYLPNKDYRDVLVTENATARIKKSKALRRPFLSWLLYDSPYGFIILNRDDFEFCENYGFVLAGDAPTTYVQCVNILSRHFYECHERPFIEFNKLVERGIDGLIAYHLCFNSNISLLDTNQRIETIIFSGYSGHRIVDCVRPEILLNILNGNVINPLRGTYKEEPSINGSSCLFIPDFDRGKVSDESWSLSLYRQVNKDFHNFLLEKEGKMLVEKKVEVYKPPNPFVKKPLIEVSNEYRFTCEQAVTVVADWLQKYVEENVNRDKE
jgi:hypothetical protein